MYIFRHSCSDDFNRSLTRRLLSVPLQNGREMLSPREPNIGNWLPLYFPLRRCNTSLKPYPSTLTKIQTGGNATRERISIDPGSPSEWACLNNVDRIPACCYPPVSLFSFAVPVSRNKWEDGLIYEAGTSHDCVAVEVCCCYRCTITYSCLTRTHVRNGKPEASNRSRGESPRQKRKQV